MHNALEMQKTLLLTSRNTAVIIGFRTSAFSVTWNKGETFVTVHLKKTTGRTDSHLETYIGKQRHKTSQPRKGKVSFLERNFLSAVNLLFVPFYATKLRMHCFVVWGRVLMLMFLGVCVRACVHILKYT